MAPPRPTITPHIGVPKVSFRKIPVVGKEFYGVDDKTAQHFGYNEVEVTFERPEHYIRYVEPAESDLSAQVEYDMDEQDDEWLAAINTERCKDQDGRVSSEIFEIVVDRLEKEWFDLMKRIPKPDQALPSEDSTCAVCDDGEGENSNAIVFCDGCNLAVHQDCYGVPYIPEGQWLCRKCTVAPESRVECILCPNEGGAFKQTSSGKWAHLLCAIWVPECILGNPTFMEPIENSDKIPKQRWRLVCSICKVKQGACIQCNKNTCVTAFHVSCARRQKLLSPMKSHGEGELQAFCEKHLPTEMRMNRVVPPSPLLPTAPGSPVRSPKKVARVQVQLTGPPLVPYMIVEKIMDYTGKIKIRKKLQFVFAVCKYWSLKRDARRGAPLLKRLHLEPWSASMASKLQTDDEKLKYLGNLNQLRDDLIQIQKVVDLVRRREEQKYLQTHLAESLVISHLLPFEADMRSVYAVITSLDRNSYFMDPVSRAEVPDYYTTITNPMHWLGIYAKIEQHEYLETQAFVDDVNLVLDNAITYNKKDTPFHKAATRIKNNAQPVLEQLKNIVHDKIAVWKMYESWEEDRQAGEAATNDLLLTETRALDLVGPNMEPVQNVENITDDNPVPSHPNGDTAVVTPLGDSAGLAPEDEIIPETPDQELPFGRGELVVQPQQATLSISTTPPVPPSGDMEPFPPILRLLQDRTSIEEDTPYMLTEDPITSFFSYERVTNKPPPPPPPPPSRQRKHKRKNTSADITMDREPSTRATRATITARVEEVSPQYSHPPRVVLLVRAPEEVQTAKRQMQQPPEVEAEPLSASTPTTKTGAKRKRQDSEGWRQVVDDVDQRDSFKLFETGWVLPAGTTRTRRPTFPSAQGNPQKTPKEPKRFRTSVSATVSRQSSQISPIESVAPTSSTEIDHLLIVSALGDPESTIPPADSILMPGPHSPVYTSKLKVTGKKANRTRSKIRSGDSSSDLSELSEVEEAKVDALVESVSVQDQDGSGVHRDADGEPTHYEPGTLVWAKQPGFPWYPAVVYDPQDEVIPPKVRQLGKTTLEKWAGPGRLYLAQFYDKNRTWTWAPLSKLTMLGEDQDIDQKYLHQSGKGVKRGELQNAYNMALQEMETPEEANLVVEVGQATIEDPLA